MRVCLLGGKRQGFSILKTIYAIDPASVVQVITYDDSTDSLSLLKEWQSWCEQHKLPLHVLSKLGELADILNAVGPDFCLVTCWYWLIPESLLKQFTMIGFHNSLLPKYRGNAPLVWALCNGESQSGVSMFYFDEGMDTGDLIAQSTFELMPTDSIVEAMQKMDDDSIALVEKYYPLLLKGIAPRMSQADSEASYCAARLPGDGLVSWNWPAKKVFNWIRAQTPPYPGAFCYLPSGEKLTLLKATLMGEAVYGAPGQVAWIWGEDAVVCCGEGAIRLHQVMKDDVNFSAGKILKYNMRLKGTSV